jgi:hypothetical protein
VEWWQLGMSQQGEVSAKIWLSTSPTARFEDVQKALDDFKNVLKTRYRLDIDKEMGYTITI